MAAYDLSSKGVREGIAKSLVEEAAQSGPDFGWEEGSIAEVDMTDYDCLPIHVDDEFGNKWRLESAGRSWRRIPLKGLGERLVATYECWSAK